jgi:prepilin-type N-terminal cleavage/methylation domain-containing protein
MRGFTLVELLVALVVLTVGLLALVTSAALVTRMIARGQRSEVAATFAGQRLERLRPEACVPPLGNGTESLRRGSQVVATNSWALTDAGNATVRIRLISTYPTYSNRLRSDTMETAVSCLR